MTETNREYLLRILKESGFTQEAKQAEYYMDNADKWYKKEQNQEVTRTPTLILLKVFNWYETMEGFSYWNRLADHLMHGEVVVDKYTREQLLNQIEGAASDYQSANVEYFLSDVKKIIRETFDALG